MSEITKETMKKARATMPSDSRHERPNMLVELVCMIMGNPVPIEMMPDANCHVAALIDWLEVCSVVVKELMGAVLEGI